MENFNIVLNKFLVNKNPFPRVIPTVKNLGTLQTADLS